MAPVCSEPVDLFHSTLKRHNQLRLDVGFTENGQRPLVGKLSPHNVLPRYRLGRYTLIGFSPIIEFAVRLIVAAGRDCHSLMRCNCSPPSRSRARRSSRSFKGWTATENGIRSMRNVIVSPAARSLRGATFLLLGARVEQDHCVWSARVAAVTPSRWIG